MRRSVSSVMWKSAKHGDILMCSIRPCQLVDLQIPRQPNYYFLGNQRANAKWSLLHPFCVTKTAKLFRFCFCSRLLAPEESSRRIRWSWGVALIRGSRLVSPHVAWVMSLGFKAHCNSVTFTLFLSVLQQSALGMLRVCTGISCITIPHFPASGTISLVTLVRRWPQEADLHFFPVS